MRKILIALFLVSMVSIGSAFAGGDGSSSNPYQIETCQHLQDMNTDLDANYTLIDDIDCTEDQSFNPIGTSSPFSGSLDGQGNEIYGLTVNQSGQAAFFNELDGSVSNLQLRDVYMNSLDDSRVAALATISSGDIDNVTASGTVDSGGLGGGIVGYNNGGTVDNSYAMVSGDDHVLSGGFVETNFGTISNSYSTGEATNGFTNFAVSNQIDTYWDTVSSGTTTTDGGATGLTTSEMQGAVQANMAFDFQNTWEIVEASDSDATSDGYPILQSVDRQSQLKAQGVLDFVEAELLNPAPQDGESFPSNQSTVELGVFVNLNEESSVELRFIVDNQVVENRTVTSSSPQSYDHPVSPDTSYNWSVRAVGEVSDVSTQTRSFTVEPNVQSVNLISPQDNEELPFFTDTVSLEGDISLGGFNQTEVNWTVDGTVVNTETVSSDGTVPYDYTVSEGESYDWSIQTEGEDSETRTFSVDTQTQGFYETSQNFTDSQVLVETFSEGDVNLTLNNQTFELQDGQNSFPVDDTNFSIRYDILQTEENSNPRVENLTFYSIKEEGIIEESTIDIETGEVSQSLSADFGEDPEYIDLLVEMEEFGNNQNDRPALNWYNLTYTQDEEVRSIGFDEYDVGLLLMLTLIGVFALVVLKS